MLARHRNSFGTELFKIEGIALLALLGGSLATYGIEAYLDNNSSLVDIGGYRLLQLVHLSLALVVGLMAAAGVYKVLFRLVLRGNPIFAHDLTLYTIRDFLRRERAGKPYLLNKPRPLDDRGRSYLALYNGYFLTGKEGKKVPFSDLDWMEWQHEGWDPFYGVYEFKMVRLSVRGRVEEYHITVPSRMGTTESIEERFDALFTYLGFKRSQEASSPKCYHYQWFSTQT